MKVREQSITDLLEIWVIILCPPFVWFCFLEHGKSFTVLSANQSMIRGAKNASNGGP